MFARSKALTPASCFSQEALTSLPRLLFFPVVDPLPCEARDQAILAPGQQLQLLVSLWGADIRERPRAFPSQGPVLVPSSKFVFDESRMVQRLHCFGRSQILQPACYLFMAVMPWQAQQLRQPWQEGGMELAQAGNRQREFDLVGVPGRDRLV